MIKISIHLSILAMAVLLAASDISHAARPRRLEYFFTLAQRYADQNTPGYCELMLNKEAYDQPTTEQLKNIRAAVAEAEGLLAQFQHYHQSGAKGIPTPLERNMDQSVRQMIEIQNRFGFELGRPNAERYSELIEGIGALLAIEGFVPTLGDLKRYSSFMELRTHEIEATPPGTEHDRLLWIYKIHLSLFQKMEGNQYLITGELPRFSDRFISRYLEFSGR